MDISKENLLELVEEQKKTIEKYSNKLRDIVSAHKSILQEKKALENTIKILNDTRSSDLKEEELVTLENKDSKNQIDTSKSDSTNELKKQLASLMTSFSTLIAEKSSMEESFKGNQKQLLDEKEAVEKKCRELQEEVKILNKHLKSVENANIKELPPLKKESKMYNKNFKSEQDNKSRSLENELLTLQVKNYEKELKTLRSELDTKKMINEICEKKLQASTFEVFKLQEQVKILQIEHQAALLKEKENAKSLEDHTKKLTASQEKRVVNLETRLAELSETIGSYERLRVQDQAEIEKLKNHIAFKNLGENKFSPEEQKTDISLSDDYDITIAHILQLKKHLEILSIKYKKEEDFKNIFPEMSNIEVSHSSCIEEYNKIKAEFESFKQEVKLLNIHSNNGKEIITLQNLVKNLQEKIRILSENNKDLEKQHQVQIDQLKKSIKNEKAKCKDAIAAAESDFQRKTLVLEAQLQKQRERSLALLEEKEQQIHSLQSTFQMFLPGCISKSENDSTDEVEVLQNKYVDGPHIVHYANELARKSLEISNLRKSKHQTEMTLRDLQKELVALTERQAYENQSFLDEISRLERCQSREGANLEYLKNVVFNFLLSNDPKSKRHMFNAIAAVLKFSQSEIQKVVEHSKNKFWANTGHST